MKTTKAKPIKAKALSKRLRAKLEACASRPIPPLASTRWSQTEARAILAALKHEREAGRLEAQPAPLFQCRRRCARLFSFEVRRDSHEETCR